MVVIHLKRADNEQFLFNCKTTDSCDDLIRELVSVLSVLSLPVCVLCLFNHFNSIFNVSFFTPVSFPSSPNTQFLSNNTPFLLLSIHIPLTAWLARALVSICLCLCLCV